MEPLSEPHAHARAGSNKDAFKTFVGMSVLFRSEPCMQRLIEQRPHVATRSITR
jgi:hypothetical protein